MNTHACLARIQVCFFVNCTSKFKVTKASDKS